jgi:2-hydroxychromene-2-carboxylate isomerase
VYEARKALKDPAVPAKARYYLKDLADWSRVYGIRIGQPPVFPVNSVKAMRGAFVALEHGVLPAYARAVFETYWGDLADISQDEVLAPIVARVGLDRGEFFRKIAEPAYKEKLRASTDELIARGGFGSPTMFVDRDDMYFGNDRLELVRAALERAPR